MAATIFFALGLLTVSGQGRPAAAGTAMVLDVDATDAPMRILHATASMPARPGTMTLFYPKWVPGDDVLTGIAAVRVQ